jgi:hypothetical protein
MPSFVTIISALAWPVVVMSALLIFRTRINQLLERVIKVGPKGFEAAPPVKQGAGTGLVLVAPSAADKLLEEFDNKLLVEAEKVITDFLDNHHVAEPERQKVLIRYLAAVSISQRFERTWYWIWGSQLKMLDALNSIKPNGLSAESLNKFYENGKNTSPELYTNYTFDQWLTFLKTWVLVREDNGIIRITLAGEEFLKYLVQTGLTANKNG